MSALLQQLAAMDWLEACGLVSGLLCVWLLIRQNIWNWPIGLVYSLVSLVVFYRARLYADLGLHVFYCVMNAYGWYYWLRGARPASESELPVTRIPHTTAVSLAVVVVVATWVSGYTLSTHTDAAVPYWDSATTMMSFGAMWMMARKHIENWVVWLVVDVIATFIYLHKDLELYAVLYGVYIAMAVAGWWAWRRTMQPQTVSS